MVWSHALIFESSVTADHQLQPFPPQVSLPSDLINSVEILYTIQLSLQCASRPVDIIQLQCLTEAAELNKDQVTST